MAGAQKQQRGVEQIEARAEAGGEQARQTQQEAFERKVADRPVQIAQETAASLTKLEEVNKLETDSSIKVENAKQINRLELAQKDTEGRIKVARVKALAKVKQGDDLSEKQAVNLSEGIGLPKALDKFQTDFLDENLDLFAPISGQFHKRNPFSTRTQIFEAATRQMSQEYGRFMEGGVLRKEDEEKYKKIFPNVTDTVEVARAKMKLVKDRMVQKHKDIVAGLRAQGFKVSKFFDIKEKGQKKKKAPSDKAGASGVIPSDPGKVVASPASRALLQKKEAQFRRMQSFAKTPQQKATVRAMRADIEDLRNRTGIR